jgi:hypothetical protein
MNPRFENGNGHLRLSAGQKPETKTEVFNGKVESPDTEEGTTIKIK